MKFTKQASGGRNTIRAYAADAVHVGERRLASSCLISATEIVEGWPVQRVSDLTLEHLASIFAWQPEIILLGAGSRATFPARQLVADVLARGIGFEAMDLGAACRTFNVLIGEDRRAVAALIL